MPFSILRFCLLFKIFIEIVRLHVNKEKVINPGLATGVCAEIIIQ